MKLRQENPFAGATAIGYLAEDLPRLVLVVDDSKDIRGCIGFILRASGFEVLEAQDGWEAQMILMKEHPTLVISDLEMPICSGWDLLSYCHAHHPDLPVLIMSGAALGQRPEVECWAAGMLAKPLSVPRFRTEVQRLISRSTQ